MAHLLLTNDTIFLSNGRKIVVYDDRGKLEQVKRQELELPNPAVSKGNKGKNDEQKPGDQEQCDGNQNPEVSNNVIFSLACCQCTHHVAACADDKRLVVWVRANTDADFIQTHSRCLPRNALCLSFLQDCDQILVADKTGDVYRVHWEKSADSYELLLGHLSIILDMVLAPGNRALVTCDRDEKIRVSCYPNCYNIKAFCLGHTEFVTSLAILTNHPKVLVSGSGDGTVRFWHLDNGHPLATIDCKNYLPPVPPVSRESTHEPEKDKCSNKLVVQKVICAHRSDIIAILYHKTPLVSLFKLKVETEKVCFEELRTEPGLLESCPLDLGFDSHDRLWTLTQTPQQPLVLFERRPTDDGLVFYQIRLEEEDDPGGDRRPLQSRNIKDINDNWEWLKGSANVPDLIPTLFKQWFDNVSQYLTQKEERLKGKESSRKRQKLKAQ